MVRNKILVAGLLCLALLAAVGCKKTEMPTPPQLTAEQHFNQGMASYQQENFSAAMYSFERATNMKPSYVQAWDYLGRCYWKQNMLQKAESAFVKAVNLQPSYLPAREYHGLLYYVQNALDLARQQLEAARGLGSIDPAVYTALGNIYLETNRCADALAAYKRALQLDSTFIKASEGQDRAKRICGTAKKTRSTTKSAPKPTPKTQFKGGAKALDPADF